MTDDNEETSGSSTDEYYEIVYYPVGEDVPIYHAFGWGGSHKGVDWIIPVGTPVPNMQDGTVYETAQDSKTYGRYVMIKHDNGYASLYAHMSKLFTAGWIWILWQHNDCLWTSRRKRPS